VDETRICAGSSVIVAILISRGDEDDPQARISDPSPDCKRRQHGNSGPS
jgi:hypothetical protein